MVEVLTCLEDLPEEPPNDYLRYAFVQSRVLLDIVFEIATIAKLPICDKLFDISADSVWRVMNQSGEIDQSRYVRVRSIMRDVSRL